ncbi:SDR family oxidoreductase [Chryseomicrobium sp. FSL W7-1435]|uniref:SDR family oxidoreductase n=1 Tax=Chryseomicrobium sp. FSL W7-1435 TaxID=2921704 RepID=UPI00315A0726
MKVFVIGANGQVGHELVNTLHKNEHHEVTAMVRKEEQQKELEDKGITSVIADLEGSVDELAEAMKGQDAVIFAAGSGGGTGQDMTLLIDLDGAVKTVEAAEQAGVQRYVMLSAFGVGDRSTWSDEIKPYYVAKYYADHHVEESSLDWTILRPGALTDDAATGKYAAGKDAEAGEITRNDVAHALAHIVDDSSTSKKAIELVNGKHPIEAALKSGI